MCVYVAQSWPSSGRIELRQFSMAYRRGLPYVLNSVNCVIEAQSKVRASHVRNV